MSKTRKSTPPSESVSRTIESVRLPMDRPAEGAMIAAMILSPKIIPSILRIVPKVEMLYHDDLREIWLTVMRLYHDPDAVVDGVTVLSDLQSRGVLEQIGGREFLQRVLDTVPSASSGEYYARIVADKAVRRALIHASYDIERSAHEADDPSEALDAASQCVHAILGMTDRGGKIVTCMEAMQTAFSEIEHKREPALMATWPELSDAIPGIYPGEMIVIAGRPGHGKSSLALSLILRNYLAGKARRVLFVSLEMRASDLMKRCLCTLTGIPFQRLRDGSALRQDQYDCVLKAMRDVQDWDLLLADAIAATPSAIRNAARSLHERKSLDAIVVDYIQRLHTTGKVATRDWEMTAISNAMKDLALELDCPIIVISQLNRNLESREDKHPRMSDLRDSGSIEQDADAILTVYRSDCYERDVQKHTNVAEIGLIKNRHGPMRTVQLTWLTDAMTFETMAHEELWDNHQSQ